MRRRIALVFFYFLVAKESVLKSKVAINSIGSSLLIRSFDDTIRYDGYIVSVGGGLEKTAVHYVPLLLDHHPQMQSPLPMREAFNPSF